MSSAANAEVAKRIGEVLGIDWKRIVGWNLECHVGDPDIITITTYLRTDELAQVMGVER